MEIKSYQGASARVRRGHWRTLRIAAATGIVLSLGLGAIASVTDDSSVDPQLPLVNQQILQMQSQELATLSASRAEFLFIPRVSLEFGDRDIGSDAPLAAPVQRSPMGLGQQTDQLTHFSLQDIDQLDTPVLVPDDSHIKATAVMSAPKARGQAGWSCLAEALYFEARGETHDGQRAVAEVILNRVDSRTYPNTICQVVGQGAHRRNACQFSYNCDGRPELIAEPRAYERAVEIAKQMVDAKKRPLTDGATHYHSVTVMPRWAGNLTRTTKIGTHIFYRDNAVLTRR